jgi:hypothetical protein
MRYLVEYLHGCDMYSKDPVILDGLSKECDYGYSEKEIEEIKELRVGDSCIIKDYHPYGECIQRITNIGE